jgi:hypothetical protein
MGHYFRHHMDTKTRSSSVHPDWKAFDAFRCRWGHSAIFSIVELAERLLHLADITSNSTISMAITKVVISENVPCNGWLWK